MAEPSSVRALPPTAAALGVRTRRSRPAEWLAGTSSDPAGLRRILRVGLARPIAGLTFLALAASAVLGLGNPVVFVALASLAAAQAVAEPISARFGHRLPADISFRFALVGWPLGLMVLGSAGWTSDRYHGEVIAVVGFVMATLVGLAEKSMLAVAWGFLAGIAALIGAAAGGLITAETLITSGAIALGSVFGERIRTIIETYLGARRQLVHDVMRVPHNPDPLTSAAMLLEPLGRWTAVRNPAFIWFRPEGGSVFLAVGGENLPAALTPGAELPPERNDVLRRQAQHGPWLTGWTVSPGDGGYTRSIAALGITVGAYVPLVFEHRVIGLLTAALAGTSSDRSAMAEHIPTLVEIADAAASALGPALDGFSARSSAARAVDLILTERRFRPVFQPIRRLSDQAIVGWEALSRFDGLDGPHEIFAEAERVGRRRELELATMAAAIDASSALPIDGWISLNASPSLLAQPEDMARLIEPIRQRVVIEISENEPIGDYQPIADCLARLGPGARLAVDDAGAGFASLRHILEVRPAFVKLDIGLVRGVSDDLTRRALIAGLVRFASEGGFTLIAEGIETTADLETLQLLGVELGQGYLLGRPVRAAHAGISAAAGETGKRPNGPDH